MRILLVEDDLQLGESLKRRLIWILLGLTLSAWVASAVLTFVYASRVMQDQVDLQLQQYSDLVNYITQVFARSLDEGRPVDEPWFREEFGRICERFYRVPGSAGLGAGLGVSIVHRIADQHGADFHEGPRVQGDGFCARLVMPATPSVREPLRVDQEGAG